MILGEGPDWADPLCPHVHSTLRGKPLVQTNSELAGGLEALADIGFLPSVAGVGVIGMPWERRVDAGTLASKSDTAPS